MMFGKLLAAGAAYVAYKTIKSMQKDSNAISAKTVAENKEKKKAVYTYAIADGQVRILIPSAFPSDNLTFDFGRRLFPHGPIYDAISYAWGEPLETAEVSISGKPFPVTPHLHSALKRIVLRSNVPIWVDAICINQNDVEKAGQVGQMAKVYETARRVIIWLGDDSEDTAEAFKLLATFGSPDDAETFSRALIESQFSPAHTKGWFGLAELLSRTWWTRAWIFQEVLVSKAAEVWCGPHTCPWETFAALAFVLEEARELFLMSSNESVAVASIMANHHHLYNLALYQRQRRMLCPPSLAEALQIRRQAGAKDPRDKVFSLLGVCREEQALPREFRGGLILTDSSQPEPPSGPDLRIDYSESYTVSDVYKGAARHIIRKCEHLEILSACENPKRHDGIPSWAPDWSRRRQTNPIVSPDAWGRIYSAAGDNPTIRFRAGATSDEIVLAGAYVDRIKAIGPARSAATSWQDVQMRWAALAVRCGKTRPDGSPLQHGDPLPNDGQCLYLEGETIEDAFLRTCVMDRIEDFRVPPGSRIDRTVLVGELSARETVARLDATECRSFGYTECWLMGLFPPGTEVGDTVVVFIGADVPFVVRNERGVGNVVVGECYLHGIMNGVIGKETWLPGRDGDGVKLAEVCLV